MRSAFASHAAPVPQVCRPAPPCPLSFPTSYPSDDPPRQARAGQLCRGRHAARSRRTTTSCCWRRRCASAGRGDLACSTTAAVVQGAGRRWTNRRLPACESDVRPRHRNAGRTLVIEDLAQDPRFAATAVRIGKTPLRFYAGVPLLSPDGHALGAVCVMDMVPRQLSATPAARAEVLARQTQHLLELRRYALEQRGCCRSAKRSRSAAGAGPRRPAAAPRDAAADRQPRPAHRPAQPLRAGAVARQPGGDAEAAAGALQPGAARHRPFQAGQRSPWPPAGRPRAARGRRCGERVDPRRRRGRALRRRGIPDRAAGHAAGRRVRGRAPHPPAGGGGVVAVPDRRCRSASPPAIRRATGPKQVFDRADQALYRAKAGGRNRVIVDDTPLHAQAAGAAACSIPVVRRRRRVRGGASSPRRSAARSALPSPTSA